LFWDGFDLKEDLLVIGIGFGDRDKKRWGKWDPYESKEVWFERMGTKL